MAAPIETTFVERAGLMQSGEGTHVVVGDVVILQEWDRLTAVSVSEARLMWEVPKPRPTPAQFNLPRRAIASGRGLWAGPSSVAHLSDAPTGLFVAAHDIGTGRAIWRSEFPTPSPVSWTESSPAYAGAHTEELPAFLARDENLVLGLARTTRRTAQAFDLRLPPLHAQLDLSGIDATSGEVRWQTKVPDVTISALEMRRFSGCLATIAGDVLNVDLATGTPCSLTKLRGSLGWPRRRRGELLVSWHDRGTVGVYALDAITGAVLRQSHWRRRGVWSTSMLLDPRSVFLQINDQFVSLLDENLAPLWEARAVPYIYGVVHTAEGPIWIGTSGRGGRLYAIDPASGTELLHLTVHGGAHDPTPIHGTDYIAWAILHGIALVNKRTMEVIQVKLKGALDVVGAIDRTIILQAGAPRPGIHLLTLL